MLAGLVSRPTDAHVAPKRP